MLNIDIKTIPHASQKYETCGDYYKDEKGKKMHVRVSELNNKVYEFLIALHELIEQFLCELSKISIESITRFDIGYEEARTGNIDAPCGCRPTEESEPGDDKHAPYYKQHQIATSIERLIGTLCPGFNWNGYEKAVNALSVSKKEHG